jgi:hypothetical protein
LKCPRSGSGQRQLDDAGRVGVNADDFRAGLGKGDRQWKANIAETHDGNAAIGATV